MPDIFKPSPQRVMSWRTFLRTHADVIAGADFFTAEAWTARGLVTHYVLFVIHHATRAVHVAGITPNPDGVLMAQIARDLTALDDGFLTPTRFLILDLDSKFTEQFQRILADAGVEIAPTACQAPNRNAMAKRWVLSVETECLSKMLLFGESPLRRAPREHTAHHHAERPQRGIGNELIEPSDDSPTGDVVEHERLGGLLRSYHRAA